MPPLHIPPPRPISPIGFPANNGGVQGTTQETVVRYQQDMLSSQWQMTDVAHVQMSDIRSPNVSQMQIRPPRMQESAQMHQDPFEPQTQANRVVAPSSRFQEIPQDVSMTHTPRVVAPSLRVHAPSNPPSVCTEQVVPSPQTQLDPRPTTMHTPAFVPSSSQGRPRDRRSTQEGLPVPSTTSPRSGAQSGVQQSAVPQLQPAEAVHIVKTVNCLFNREGNTMVCDLGARYEP